MLNRGLARHGPVRLRQRLQRRTPPYLGQVRQSPLRGRTGRVRRVPSRWPTPSSSRPAHGNSPRRQQECPHGLPGVSVILGITLGLQPPMRYHGARTRPSAYWSSAGDCSLVPRFAGSAGLVSPRDASNDVPSIFAKRSERQARSPRDHVSAERRPVGYLEPSGLGRMPDRVEESTPSDQVARCREAQ